MTRFILRITESVVRHPVLWLVPLAAVYLFSLAQLPKLGVDNSLDIWFKRNDPTIDAYQQFQDTFGSDETILAVFRDNESPLSIMHIRFIANVTKALVDLPGILRVTSLANLPNPELVVSEDGHATVFVIEPVSFELMDEVRSDVISSVRATLDEQFASTPWEYHAAGIGVIHDALNTATLVDSRVMFGLSYLLMILLLALFVRELRLVLVCGMALLYAVTVSVGIYLAAGRQFNMITIVIPSVVTVYAVSDALHIVHSYRRRTQQHPHLEKQALIRVSVRAVVVPCLLTSITTAGGFLTLMVSNIRVIRDLGLFAALGIVVAYLSTLLVLTLGFRLFPVPAFRRTAPRVLKQLKPALKTNRNAILLGAALLTGALAAGIPRLTVDTYSIDLLPQNHPVRRDSDFIESNFGYYTPAEFLLSGRSINPTLVTELERISTDIETHPLLSHPVSALHIVPNATRAETSEQLARSVEQANIELLSMFIDRETSSMRISARTKMQSARGFKSVIDDILESNESADYSLVSVGYLPLYVRMMQYIPSTQILSSVLALMVVLCLFLLYSGSVRLAMFALLANVVPIVAVLGFMGWLRVPLDIATVTITAMAIGIIVDDTIHMIHGIRKASGLSTSRHESVVSALAESGAPIVATTVVLGLGYCLMVFATVRSISRFGLLTAFILFVALLCDLYLLPALYTGGRRVGGR